MELMAIEADSRGFISRVKAGIEGGRGEMGELMAARLCVRFWWSRIDQRWRKVRRWRLRHCSMKVTTLGSLTGWAHLSARGWRRPNQTSGAMAESDKRSRRWADWAGQGGRRWAAARLENKGGGWAETISQAEIK
jgi:hypothetical protein